MIVSFQSNANALFWHVRFHSSAGRSTYLGRLIAVIANGKGQLYVLALSSTVLSLRRPENDLKSFFVVERYFRILVTTPAPTVRPPSRIAKRKPSSRATGTISSMARLVLSPGMTISTPDGSWTEPVTSVVRK